MAPGELTPRTDAGARVIVQRLDELRDRMENFEEHLDSKLESKTRGHVTWQGLAGSVVALVGLIFIVVAALTAPVKESAAATRQEMKEARKDLAEEVRDLKRDVSAKVEKIDARVEGIWKVNVEGRPRGPVREEVQRRTDKEQ